MEGEGIGGGGDESVRQRAGSQWIVAARPLCHLQCPVAYLSRLQRIQPADRLEFHFKGDPAARPPRGQHPSAWARGGLRVGPYCGSVAGRRARAPLV